MTGNFHLTSQIAIMFNMQKDYQVQFSQEVLMICFEVLLFFLCSFLRLLLTCVKIKFEIKIVWQKRSGQRGWRNRKLGRMCGKTEAPFMLTNVARKIPELDNITQQLQLTPGIH